MDNTSDFSHIPKRVVQNMIYHTNEERQRPSLKIGQTLDSVYHRNFYSVVADTKLKEKSILNEGHHFTDRHTEFQDEFGKYKVLPQTVNDTRKTPVGTGFQDLKPTQTLLHALDVKGSHGVNVRENNNLMKTLKVGQDGNRMSSTGMHPVTDYSGCNEQILTQYKRAHPPCERSNIFLKNEITASTSNWISTNHADLNSQPFTNFKHFRQREPPYEGVQFECLERPTLRSCFQIDYGHDPRSMMNTNSTALPIRNNDLLLAESTKISQHPPGYGSYLPKVLRTSVLESYGKGVNIRPSHNKEVLRITYNHELPGYSGQTFPLCALNDKGPRKPQLASTIQSALLQPYTLKL